MKKEKRVFEGIVTRDFNGEEVPQIDGDWEYTDFLERHCDGKRVRVTVEVL